ncbi:MAG: flagellar hook-associated protein FlgL [Pseudohongiellaceae bacterium]
MRISTVTIFEQGVSSMHRQQNNFMETGQQIASGRRVVRPSDDPQAAAQAVGVSRSRAVTEQYMDARVSARNSLSQEESVLASVADGISSAKTLLIQGASDTLSDADRSSVASELKGIRETLLGQANATDGNGRYLFGGYENGSAPFLKDATGAIQYTGDANALELRIDASRQMPVADNGETVFQSVPGGTGYVAEAGDGNTGSARFTGPGTLDPSDPDHGSAFTIDFSVTAGTTEYSVNGGALQAYQAGDPIEFGGLSLTVEGSPEDGDSIAVAPAQQMNTDLFATLNKAIDVLDTPNQTDADRARLHNTLSTAMRELDNSLDNVLTTRASVGARLNELDTVDSVAEQRLLNYDQALSDLVDLDYVEAISDYSRRQIGLEAAQKSFADISRLSLFRHI